MPAFEWVHVQLHQQKGMISLSPPTICNSALKAELIWRRHWQTRRDIEIAIFEYINGFYNPRRRHSTLGWKSPVAFEKKAA
ncbi:TPA: IS3 family transposase [Salmonella enterica]|nr:IS3 family transposase [Salmonella enterica]HAK3675262.1 IS3 family transposase [Salmonella enterica]